MKMIRNKLPFLLLLAVMLSITGCGQNGGEASDTELSREEIDWFNTVFFNSGDDLNEHNLFLLCTYNKPEQIDLFQVFYNGISMTSGQVSDDELAELEQIDSEAAYLDITKITETEMDGCLRSNLGIGLEDIGHSGLDDFIYLEKYGAYYLVHSDSNYTACTVTSGTKDDEGTVILQFENLDGIQMEVRLRETEGGYQFLSNAQNEKPIG